MARSSLRVWPLRVSALFAAFVIGGASLATYFVILHVMSEVAHDASGRAATHVAGIISARSAAALQQSAEQGLMGAERDQAATRRFVDGLSVIAGIGNGMNVQVALYDAQLSRMWFVEDYVAVDSVDARERVVRGGASSETVRAGGSTFSGLFGRATLGVYVVHVPFDLPDGTRGVLDVVYYPLTEEAVIDAIRTPMAWLTLVAAVFAVALVRFGMEWILKPVKNLRAAADSIEAGDLDVRLPVEGEHEIAELARTLNLLIGRLRHQTAMQARFVADASHELATPVAGIRGYTNILRAWGAGDADVRNEAIEAIDRESRRMARLCGDLLSLVKSEQSGQVKTVSYDVNEVAREVMASALTRYQDKKVNHEGPPGDALDAVGDPERLEDVLSVLLDNAFKYTPTGGTVTIDTRLDGDVLVIDVEDTGIGIAEEEIENVFERFYRSDESRSKATGGFGLGLPIARTVVESMGGTIAVRSARGSGATFTVRVPRTL